MMRGIVRAQLIWTEPPLVRCTPEERLTMYLPRMMILPAAVSVMLDLPQRSVSCFRAVTTRSSGGRRAGGSMGVVLFPFPFELLLTCNIASGIATAPPPAQ